MEFFLQFLDKRYFCTKKGHYEKYTDLSGQRFNRKVGACISERKRLESIGHQFFISKLLSEACPWKFCQTSKESHLKGKLWWCGAIIH